MSLSPCWPARCWPCLDGTCSSQSGLPTLYGYASTAETRRDPDDFMLRGQSVLSAAGVPVCECPRVNAMAATCVDRLCRMGHGLLQPNRSVACSRVPSPAPRASSSSPPGGNVWAGPDPAILGGEADPPALRTVRFPSPNPLRWQVGEAARAPHGWSGSPARL